MNTRFPLLSFFGALVLSIAPPVVLTILLNPEGPLPIVLGYAFAVQICAFLANREKEDRFDPWSIAVVAIFIIGAVVLFIQILITPLSAYLVWFRLVQSLEMRGSVSFIFVSFTGYFAALTTSFFYRYRFTRPFLAYITVLSFTGFIITKHWAFFLTLLIAFTVFLLLVVKKRYQGAFFIRRAIFTVAVLLIFVGIISVPISNGITPRGNRLVDKKVSPGLREFVVRIFPRFPLLYGIPGYGSSISEKQLGEPPVLSQRSIFRVGGPPGATLYLRTAVFDQFLGEGWYTKQEIDENAVPKTPIDDLTVNERELTRRPVITRKRDALEDADSIVSIEVLADFHPTLPHTLKTTVIYSEKELEVEYGTRYSGYKLENPLLHGDKIILKQKAYKQLPNMSEKQKSLERKELEPFLRLPENISDDVEELAQSLAQDTVQASLTSIGSYLSEEYRYTLEPDRREKGEKFLDSFLFDKKEGFCVHFATSFIVLARLNNIPARYATGYIVNMPSPDMYPGGMYSYSEPSPTLRSGAEGTADGSNIIPAELGNIGALVTGYSSHAWPEVFVPEIGWIPYEATPPMRPEAYDDPNYWQRYFSTDQAYTVRQIQAIAGNRVPEPGTEEKKRRDIPVLPFLIPIFALAAAGALYFVIVKIKNRPKGPKRLTALRRVGKRILRYTGKKGIPHPSDSGWIAWENRVYSLLYGALGTYEMATGEMSEKLIETSGVPSHPGFAGEIFRKSFFSSYYPDEDDLDTLRKLKREIRSTRRSYFR